jgi:arylsulfatase
VPWELYDHRVDPSEVHDLAESDPLLVKQMEQLWWAEAGRYDVLPVDTRHRSKRQSARIVRPAGARPGGAVFFGTGGPFESGVAPTVTNRSFGVLAEVEVTPTASGVLYMFGSRHGGYCLYLDEGRLAFEVGVSSIESQTIVSDRALEAGRHLIELRVTADDDLRGAIKLFVDRVQVGSGEVPRLLRVMRARTYVGYAETQTVSEIFEPPFRFEGKLTRLEVTLIQPG